MYNVMIVDDESVIRKGLICFVDWKLLDCNLACEATNGLEALEKLNDYDIDILITDIKMPGMDGIELSKHVYDNYSNIKIIMLTAYADFSYAQLAIKYNVVDFIIKTNPSDKIIEAVNKAKHMIELQKEKEKNLTYMEGMINKNLSAIHEKFFNDVFSGLIYIPEEIEKKITEYDITLENYCILSFEISDLSGKYNSASTHDHRDFISSIKNFLSLALKDYTHHIFMMNTDLLITLVSTNDFKPSAFLQSLISICNEILEIVSSFMKFSLSIGIGDMHTSSYDLQKAYNESLEALMGNFPNNNQPLVYKACTNNLSGNTTFDSHKYIEELSNNLSYGNCSEAASTLKTLFYEYRNNNLPKEQFKVSGILIYSLCSRLIENYAIDAAEDTGANSEIYRQICESKSLQSLYYILLRLLETTSAFIASKEKQHSNLIKEVNRYIKSNYHNDIDLQSIADYIHVSSNYLCRLYKRETGESVIDTLNKYRIEIAKKLLANSGLKIYEIANSVGFKDQSYFTYVFKKYSGVSPKEFMNQHNHYF